MHAPFAVIVFLGEKEFEIQHADQYPQLLREKGSVVADFNERKAEILAKFSSKSDRTWRRG